MFPTAARIPSVVERAAPSFSYEDVLNHQVTFDAAAWRETWSHLTLYRRCNTPSSSDAIGQFLRCLKSGD